MASVGSKKHPLTATRTRAASIRDGLRGASSVRRLPIYASARTTKPRPGSHSKRITEAVCFCRREPRRARLSIDIVGTNSSL